MAELKSPQEMTLDEIVEEYGRKFRGVQTYATREEQQEASIRKGLLRTEYEKRTQMALPLREGPRFETRKIL